MADYKELLRRAIAALPENNGAARRAVYEKARSALVGQLRAIQPPLPARDITQHRLQLEDCIRQVEQEASEAVITLGRDLAPRPEPAPRPAPAAVPAPEPAPAAPTAVVEKPKPAPVPQPTPKPEAQAPAAEGKVSIEDIIAEAAATSGAEVTPAAVPAKPEPALVPRSEPVKSSPATPPAGPANVRPLEPTPRAPAFEHRREPAPLAANSSVEPVRSVARIEPSMGNAALARQPVEEIVAVEPALSSVREVELEDSPADTREAEGAIASAIETLDREARGESTPALPDRSETSAQTAETDADESGFVDTPTTTRSGAGLTIFLIVFAVLLVGAGGVGFWAWREGYVDLEQMFGQAQPAVAETVATDIGTTPATPTMDPAQAVEPTTDTATGPGNTATTQTPEATTSLEGVEIDDRLEPTPEPVVPSGSETVLPDIGSNAEDKGEERLPESDAAVAANDPAASVDPAVLAGSQSLLLEASADGRTGAVPFSGTVEWSEGSDELGLPTLVGHANIPARNLGVNITIRKNTDPSLPASHLMEVDFQVNDTFVGGSIASLPGVLLKDEELVPGTPLVGASARVVGNSFLFALSASDSDAQTNRTLLEDRKWMDLAVVYGTGRNAIITLEKDDEALALFDKVFTAWAQ